MKYKTDKATLGMIFDLDGTLADTMPFHFKAWQLTCREYGMEMTRKFLQDHMGRPGWEIAKDIIRDHNLEKELISEDLFNAKISRYKSLEEGVKLIEPVGDIVKENYGRIPLSVGTGGFREAAYHTMLLIGMTQYFDIVVTANDVSNHKPHPETFLKCAGLMKIKPADIVVFEDGNLGIEAAQRAGMQVVDIRPWIKPW